MYSLSCMLALEISQRAIRSDRLCLCLEDHQPEESYTAALFIPWVRDQLS